MKKTLFGIGILLTSLSMPTISSANNQNDFQQNPLEYPNDYYSMHSLGCLLLQECKGGITKVTSQSDLENYYDYTINAGEELNQMFKSFNKLGIEVYIAPEEYFPVGHRGVYHTVSNNFYLNERYMSKPHVLMSVIRHEGWHAAQDCMAGSLDNTFIAVIKNDNEIPQLWKDIAKDTYPLSALPWEQEAMWAGKVENMTANALKACETGAMWDQPGYSPTPLTKKFLIDKGYIKE